MYIIFGLRVQVSATLDKVVAVPFIEQINKWPCKEERLNC